jgi:16S rRNA (uracil1498-N3)-methyltransferase
VRRRFFVDQFTEQRAVMEGETARHLGKVLRAQPGQLYELSDGRRVCLARVESVGRDRVEFSLAGDIPARQPVVQVTLLLSIVKFDAFEWAIEKATELGVSTIVPLAAERSERVLVSAAGKRAERWSKLLVEASQQSRRLSIPVLEQVRQPNEVFSLPQEGFRILLSESEKAPLLRGVLSDATHKAVTLAIGPEGGWTGRELEAAGQAGFHQASLGGLILRAETAVIAALASINFALA